MKVIFNNVFSLEFSPPTLQSPLSFQVLRMIFQHLLCLPICRDKKENLVLLEMPFGTNYTHLTRLQLDLNYSHE